MGTKEPRFDVHFYGNVEVDMDYHFCRSWDEEGNGCYGTNPNHGFTFEDAKAEMISYYKKKIDWLEKLTFDEWNIYEVAPSND